MDAEWWSAIAPGAPGTGEHRFLLVRTNASSGSIRTVWSWSRVRDVRFAPDDVAIAGTDGAVLHYVWDDDGARISPPPATLAGHRIALPITDDTPAAPSPMVHTLPFARDLGEADYRTSEPSWADAGAPAAHVSIRATDVAVEVLVQVHKRPLYFRPPDGPDPALDNEYPDINSDGVQLHLWREGWPEPVAWLAVPDPQSSRVRLRESAGGDHAPLLGVSWRETASGYEMQFTIPLDALAPEFAIDILINDMSADRARRRGQLVLSGAHGERVYLRGDRQPLDRFLRVRLPA